MKKGSTGVLVPPIRARLLLQDNVDGHASGHPGHLRAGRCALHARDDALEHAFDRQARHLDVADEFGGEDRIRPLAVGSLGVGRGRVKHQRIARRAADDGKAARSRAKRQLPLQGIVAAGIEDDDVRSIAGIGQRLQDPVQRYGDDIELVFPRRIGLDRKKIIHPPNLHPVPGKKDDACSAVAKPRGVVENGAGKGFTARVFDCRDLKTEPA